MVRDFDPSDKRGDYLVLFEDGLKFRYKARELERPEGPPHSSVLNTLTRVLTERRHNLFRGSEDR